MYDYRQIVLEGNIGAGKTTCASLLADELEARLILESFDDNPFLPQFYADRVRYGFQVELFFLAERYKQLSQNLLGDIFSDYTVYDYHFAKSAVFSRVNLSGDETNLYRNLYQIMERFVPIPDIIIYLHYSVDQLKQRIEDRSRPYEQGIQASYLEDIEVNYFHHFREITRFPVVVLDLSDHSGLNSQEVLSLVNGVLSKNWKPGLSTVNP